MVVQSTFPAASFTVTVEPASARPATGEPSVTLTVGAAGADESGVTDVGADTLPTASVAVTDSTTPLAGTDAGVHENVPAAVAVAVQIVTPPASFTVTVEPASAVPAMGEPSVGATTGAFGTAESTMTDIGPEVLPAGSVATAVTTAPFVRAGAIGHVQAPVAEATTVHRVVPAAFFTMTVAPGSAEPDTDEPLVGFTTGGSAASRSTVTFATNDVLPARSVADTEMTAPLAGTGTGSQLKEPAAEATAVHRTVPAAFFTVTVEPASAEPVMGEPSVGLRTGVAGAAESAVTEVGADTLPAGSVAVTDSTAPLAGTEAGEHENVPAAVAVVVQIVAPPASFTVTVEPASAVPVMGEPSVGATIGATGATVSTVTTAGPETCPAGSVAVTVRS